MPALDLAENGKTSPKDQIEMPEENQTETNRHHPLWYLHHRLLPIHRYWGLARRIAIKNIANTFS